jgi:hypothetical protein
MCRLSVSRRLTKTLRALATGRVFAILWSLSGLKADAAGVTVITHGYDGNAQGWITAMAQAISGYNTNATADFVAYTLTLTTDGTDYFHQWSHDAGPMPLASTNCELLVKLDWSQMAGSPDPFSSVDDVSTYNVAQTLVTVLTGTNMLSELGGHALAEFPLHLIGHSRGGSLMNETSRLLGRSGVWVDHLTTLDPHPLNNDGNSDLFLPTDATAAVTYETVLFRDNYWQNLGVLADIDGESAAGAYNRQLASLDGGYTVNNFVSPYHANAHLWYHGTVALDTPAAYNLGGDTATIDATMRSAWWGTGEQEGGRAGFFHSLIAGGDRLSTTPPLGPGYPAIVDGYNQKWDLGAGLGANRTALDANSGEWPSLVKIDITGQTAVTRGTAVGLAFYYQDPGATNLTVELAFDPDRNPLNRNEAAFSPVRLNVPAAGRMGVVNALGLNTTNLPPGTYSVVTAISNGARVRYLYAPEAVTILPDLTPPTISLDWPVNAAAPTVVVRGRIGQSVTLEASDDLLHWTIVGAQALTVPEWDLPYDPSVGGEARFFRALVGP